MVKMGESQNGDNIIPEFQNFLKFASLIKTGLTPNDQGIINLQLNLQPYTQLHVIAIDKASVCKKQIDLDEFALIPRRDLSLSQTLDVSKGYTESRTITLLGKGETCTIEDITSTEVQIVDDLTKVQSIIESIVKGKNQNSDTTFTQLLPVFQNWHINSTEEKNKTYNKYFSHELNIFLYHKDQKYFEDVVKPYITNKMEKQFIDFYLLKMDSEVMDYNQIPKVQKLSPMEICFLIDTLSRNGKISEAAKLLNYMDFQRRQNDKSFKEHSYNQIFDTILNMNMNSEDGSKGIDLSLQPATILVNQSMQMASSYATNMFGRSRGERMEKLQECEMRNCDLELFGDEDDDYGCEQERFKSRSREMYQVKKQNRNYDRDVFDERERQRAGGRRHGFEELQKTGEYKETHFFDKNKDNQGQSLHPFNGFWYDYANYLIEKNQHFNEETSSLMSDTETQIQTSFSRFKPFISTNFIMNGQQAHNALLTFVFMDLPLKAQVHDFKTNEGRGQSITTNGHAILLKKEVKEAELELSNDILITHRYTKANDAYVSSSQAAMIEEFLTNTAYQCEVIMTNVSPEQKDFSILYQIPQGSVPLTMTKYMKSQTMNLSSYTTQKLIFQFYFPSVGKYTHFPSSASKNEKIIAKAPINQLQAVDHLTIRKSETFMDILITGSKDDLLEFLRTIDLSQCEKQYAEDYIFWMMKDKAFFLQVVDIHRSQYFYSSKIWSYGFYHNDEQTMREFFEQSMYTELLNKLGTDFQSTLVNIIGERDKNIKHLDYYPVLNSRAHNVGDVQQWTLNKNLRETYERLVQHFILKKDLTLEDKMQIVYFLQIQDRVQEAISMLEKIDIEKEKASQTLRIQYDYFKAYFDFFTGETESYKTARAIVRKYEDYPVSSWRLLFLEILDQLNEIDGESEEPFDFEGDVLTDEQKRLKQKKSAKKEPRLEVEVDSEKKSIQLEVANFRAIVIKFYIIDAEILFSRTPFLKESTSEFSYVKPCHTIEKQMETPDLNASIDTISYLQQPQIYNLDIPEEFKNQNMVIEVTGEGKQIFKTYYPTQIKVNILSEYGELKVTDVEGKALSKIYVKVFYQKKGQSTDNAAFYKDGYTDIRGKFEYAQTSGDKLKEVEKFAIFVMSDNLGSIIKEVDPPKVEGGAEQVQLVMQQRKENRIYSKVANYQAKSKISKK